MARTIKRPTYRDYTKVTPKEKPERVCPACGSGIGKGEPGLLQCYSCGSEFYWERDRSELCKVAVKSEPFGVIGMGW